VIQEKTLNWSPFAVFFKYKNMTCIASWRTMDHACTRVINSLSSWYHLNRNPKGGYFFFGNDLPWVKINLGALQFWDDHIHLPWTPLMVDKQSMFWLNNDLSHIFSNACCTLIAVTPVQACKPPSRGPQDFSSGPKIFERDRLCMLGGHLSRCHTKYPDQWGPRALSWGPWARLWGPSVHACACSFRDVRLASLAWHYGILLRARVDRSVIMWSARHYWSER
jgi:hypothetical protein